MSNQPKHTPGPWTIHKQNAYHISYVVRGGKKENQIAQCFNWQDKGFDVNSEANAQLIAAAPELLEALDGLTLVIGLTPILGNKEALQEAMNAARDAIAKAEGRAE